MQTLEVQIFSSSKTVLETLTVGRLETFTVGRQLKCVYSVYLDIVRYLFVFENIFITDNIGDCV